MNSTVQLTNAKTPAVPDGRSASMRRQHRDTGKKRDLFAGLFERISIFMTVSSASSRTEAALSFGKTVCVKWFFRWERRRCAAPAITIPDISKNLKTSGKLHYLCPAQRSRKILMNRRMPVHFLHKKDEKEEIYPDYDPIFFDQLQEAREVMIQILQNRSLPASVRALLILGLAHDMQLRFNGGSFFTCQQLYSRYQSREAASYASEWLKGKEKNACQAVREENQQEVHVAAVCFAQLYELEHLRADWETVLRETESLLFKEASENDRDSYRRISKEFGAYIMTEYPDWEIQKEQLLVYFISTYFCGAVYDGHIYSKVRMAVLCVWYIEELLKARWLRNEKFLDTEEVCEIVYRFSREIEHSDQNLEAAEKIPIPFP